MFFLMKRTMLFLLAAMACANLRANAPAAYFDALDKSKIPPHDFMVAVSSVQADSPAERADLRAGDLIAGVDGIRARCRPDIVLLRRLAAKKSEDVTLNVVRNGAWVDVTLPNRDSITAWTGFGRADNTPKTAKRLLAWGVGIETLEGHGIDPVTGAPWPKPTANDFEEDMKKLATGTQPWHTLAKQNFRMQEALCALAEKGGDENRAWVEELVRTICFLLLENFDEAEKISGRLVSRKVDPFLDEVAKFYAAVAHDRGGFAETGDWQKFGVDENFFANCYPWPTVAKKTVAKVFAFDKELQEAYRLAGF